MAKKIIKIIRHGGITLPKECRDKYNLQEGDVLEWDDNNGVFTLIPLEPRKKKL